MRDIVDHRYRVEQKLAAGGFGAIYRATDLQIDRPVALKVLHRELAGDASVVARFRLEAAALATLKSPHTLTLYDVGETDDTLYLVMELLRGESLQEVFDRNGTLPWRRLVKIARGVCSSLREAHDHGIVHRDLKPANIFLETHALDVDFVKVLDFGIAKIMESSDLDNRDLTRHGQMIGTFDYMSPEQMVGGRCTGKSDVFTLGVVMYEMLSGKRPYGEARGPASMLMALLSTTPVPLSGIPPELARVVMRCIAKDPQDRPDVIELDTALDHAFAHQEPIYNDLDGPTVLETTNEMTADTMIAPHDSTRILARAPKRHARKTPPRGSVQPLHLGGLLAGELARQSKPASRPMMMAPVTPAQPSARGSDFAISFRARGTEAPPVARGSESVIASSPNPRLASGTAPIVNERAASALPVAPQNNAAVAARWILLAISLFGIGFLGALTLTSL